MKHNLNVIHINGIRGIIFASCVVCCLFAGFIVFPGMLAMIIWNKLAQYSLSVPSIGIIQGVLLWGIVIALYFILKKDRIILCVKSPKGLTEEELKAVLADMKEHSEEDIVLKNMLKAREAELKLKNNVTDNKSDEADADKQI